MNKKELTDTQKNRIKRIQRKVSEGILRPIISWFDFIKSKPEIKIEDFQQWLYPYGRIGNKVYTRKHNNKCELFIKFKNATKAKKFMEMINNGK